LPSQTAAIATTLTFTLSPVAQDMEGKIARRRENRAFFQREGLVAQAAALATEIERMEHELARLRSR
jgi:hypothetical protein